jgi:hypothetical protein
MVHATQMLAAQSTEQPALFAQTRARLTDLLVGASLIESYHSFLAHGKPYPFIAPESLLPGASAGAIEQPFQRAALVIAVDGVMPVSLNKHIRMRRPSQVTPSNLARLAPELDHGLITPAALSPDADGFTPLFAELLKLDYALVLQHDAAARLVLSHMHVKIERLTDNAIRELAKALGYIERRLFERGEAYVEALEAKFYEYYGFAPNASGRKSAAAMAAQLLGAKGARFVVFAACQEDCRLTVIDDGDRIEHYVLAALPSDAFGATVGLHHMPRYALATSETAAGTETVVIYRVRFRRTAFAHPSALANGRRRADAERGLTRPWLELVDEALVPRPGELAPAVDYRRLSRDLV